MFQTICSFSSLLSSHVTSYLMFLFPLLFSLPSLYKKIMNIDLKAQLVIKMGANIFFFPLSASFIASLISLNRMTCKLKEVPEEKQHSSQERERETNPRRKTIKGNTYLLSCPKTFFLFFLLRRLTDSLSLFLRLDLD